MLKEYSRISIALPLSFDDFLTFDDSRLSFADDDLGAEGGEGVFSGGEVEWGGTGVPRWTMMIRNCKSVK